MTSTSSTETTMAAAAAVVASTLPAVDTSSSSSSSNGKAIEANFTSEIFHLIATETSTDTSVAHPKNIIISPLLLEAALALLYLGSDGHTAEELKRLLNLERFANNIKMANYYAEALQVATKETDTKIELSQKYIVPTAERVEISEEFRKIAQKYFQTSVDQCEMQNEEALVHSLTVSESWAKSSGQNKQTSEVSPSLAASIAASLAPLATAESMAESILLTAGNFKSKWFLPFSAYRSGIYEFHESVAADEKPQRPPQAVPMLYDEDMFVKFVECRELDARVMELPYEHELELSMLLILPNKRDGLAELLLRLRGHNLQQLTDRLQMESVQVLLPKFSIDFECSLRPYMEKLGLTSLFGEKANLKNALKDNSKGSLRVAEMLHRVRIDVNESGSEVSNVQVLKPIVITNSTRQKIFRADHPFFFAIRCADVTLLMGQVTTCQTNVRLNNNGS